MSYMIHPEKPVVRKMTPAQEDLLRKIVATNGGGVDVSGPYRNAAKALVARHFIQGKRGQGYIAVHTREGLEWVRNNPQQ